MSNWEKRDLIGPEHYDYLSNDDFVYVEWADGTWPGIVKVIDLRRFNWPEEFSDAKLFNVEVRVASLDAQIEAQAARTKAFVNDPVKMRALYKALGIETPEKKRRKREEGIVANA